MPNPPILICDSDVLIQLFLTDELRPLKELKRLYGVQPAIVQEVDIELRSPGHYGRRFVPQLEKSLKSGLFVKLDKSVFQSFLSTAPPGASWASFQSLGSQYLGLVDKGEAYTHAAGVILGVPTASDDFRALQVLEFQMQNLPCPVLRSFDLLVFAVDCGIVSDADFDKIRSCLRNESRFIPHAFKNASFAQGRANFYSRLRDSKGADSAEMQKPMSFSGTLSVTRV